MDLDAAAIGFAIKNEESFKAVKEAGIDVDLFLKRGQAAWKFVHDYQSEHGKLPLAEIIRENTGVEIVQQDGVAISYIADQLHERAIYRALEYGLDKSLEYLSKGEQKESETEVLKLADYIRLRKAKKVRAYTLGDVVDDVWQMYENTKNGVIGIPFPWKIMTDMTMGMWPGTVTFFVARPGVGKCVEENTRIVNPDTGIETTIRDVVEGDQPDVYSLDLNSGIGIQPIGAKVDTGSKECLEVSLASGRTIVVTPEHPFLTPTGWVRADCLGYRAIIGVPSSLPSPQHPESMGMDNVRMLALLLAEGSSSGNHVGFSTADERMIEIAKEFSEPRGAHVVYRGGYDYDVSVGNHGGGIIKNPARELLRRLGIDGHVAREKLIPDAVYSLPNDELAEFLSVFWMADGYIDNGAPCITLASEKMVRQLQHLLLRFGVQSSIVYKPVKKGVFHSWRLRVYSICWPRFAESIRLWGDKDWRMKESIARDGVRNPNTGSPKRVKKIDGVFWDRVVQVRDVGVRRIFDLTVSPTSNFVANDIIVHNTWTAVNIVWNAHFEHGKKTLIVSPEMTRVELVERVIARHGQFNYSDMVSGTLGSFVEPQLKKVIDELRSVDGFWILDDEDRLGPTYIEEAIDATNPDLIAIDAIYMLNVAEGKIKSGPGSRGGRYDRILGTVDWLRSLSRRTSKPIVGISQLSREGGKIKQIDKDVIKGGKGTGGLEDALAMTDTLFWDAQNLFAMYQDDDMKTDKQMLYVPLKARRQAKWSAVVTNWNMDEMNFDQIGSHVEKKDATEDSSNDDDAIF